MKISPFVRKLLEYLAAHEHARPTALAHHLWPDSPGWQRVSNCGTNGARRGAGPPRAAGVWLWKLEALGLARHVLTFGVVRRRGGGTRQGVVSEWWEITDAGRKALREGDDGDGREEAAAPEAAGAHAKRRARPRA